MKPKSCRRIPVKYKKTAAFGAAVVLLLNTSCATLNNIANQAVSGQPLDVKSLGLAAAQDAFTPQVLPEYPQDPLNDKAINDYANAVAAKLEAHALNHDFQVQILKTAKVNGFSNYGSHDIQVTRGLLNMMRNEAELACLIGHEMGHVDLGHDKKVYQKSYTDSAASAGILLIGQATGQSEVAGTVDYAHNNMTVANYGQQMEQDADEYGAVLAAKAGYDPYAFVDLFNRLAQKRGTDLAVHMNALTEGHKSTDVRAEHLLEFLRAKGYQRGGILGVKAFQAAMVDLKTIRTGEGLQQASATVKLTKDEQTVADFQKEVDQDGAQGGKISGKRFVEIMRQVSALCQKNGITRQMLMGNVPEKDTAVHKFMDDNLTQDYPYPPDSPGQKPDQNNDKKPSLLDRIRKLLGIKTAEERQQEIDARIAKGETHSSDYYEKNINSALLHMTVGGIPTVGNGFGLYEGLSGRDFNTGEPLNKTDVTMSDIGGIAISSGGYPGWENWDYNVATVGGGASNAGSYFKTLSGLYEDAAVDVGSAVNDGLKSAQSAGKILDNGTDWERTDDPSTAPARDGVYQFQTKADQAYYKVNLGGQDVYFDHPPTADDGIENPADDAEQEIIPSGTTLTIQKVQGKMVFLKK